jgi:hypothetical protein
MSDAISEKSYEDDHIEYKHAYTERDNSTRER